MTKTTKVYEDNKLEQVTLNIQQDTIEALHTYESTGVDPEVQLRVNDADIIKLTQHSWSTLKEVIEELFEEDE